MADDDDNDNGGDIANYVLLAENTGNLRYWYNPQSVNRWWWW